MKGKGETAKSEMRRERVKGEREKRKRKRGKEKEEKDKGKAQRAKGEGERGKGKGESANGKRQMTKGDERKAKGQRAKGEKRKSKGKDQRAKGERGKGVGYKDMMEKDEYQNNKRLENHKKKGQSQYGSGRALLSLSTVLKRPFNALLEQCRSWLQIVFQSFSICVNKKELILTTAQKK